MDLIRTSDVSVACERDDRLGSCHLLMGRAAPPLEGVASVHGRSADALHTHADEKILETAGPPARRAARDRTRAVVVGAMRISSCRRQCRV